MDTISKAVCEDAEAILDLQKRAYESEARLYGDWSIPPLTQTLAQLREEMSGSCVLKCMRDGAIVGSVRAHTVNGACQVGRLIVEPECQRQGIGSALLRAIQREFPDAFRFELFTGDKSEGNIRLYRRHGYEMTGTRALSPQVVLVCMAKDVGPSACRSR
jgi:ribosomal protein S18 acetylase RimI-like enzyme